MTRGKLVAGCALIVALAGSIAYFNNAAEIAVAPIARNTRAPAGAPIPADQARLASPEFEAAATLAVMAPRFRGTGWKVEGAKRDDDGKVALALAPDQEMVAALTRSTFTNEERDEMLAELNDGKAPELSQAEREHLRQIRERMSGDAVKLTERAVADGRIPAQAPANVVSEKWED